MSKRRCDHPRCKTPDARVARRPNVRWSTIPHLCDACYLKILRPLELNMDIRQDRSTHVATQRPITRHADRRIAPRFPREAMQGLEDG